MSGAVAIFPSVHLFLVKRSAPPDENEMNPICTVGSLPLRRCPQSNSAANYLKHVS